jgi:hypothetical protein
MGGVAHLHCCMAFSGIDKWVIARKTLITYLMLFVNLDNHAELADII